MGNIDLRTSIDIDAGAERVWSILTDFPRYPEWNPFIRLVRGELVRGARLEVRIQPIGAKGMTFRPKLLEVVPGRELRWLGYFLFPGLFDGEHSFVIEPLSTGRVRFRQNESFGGILVPLLKRNLENGTKRGFEEMNRALKAVAEKQT